MSRVRASLKMAGLALLGAARGRGRGRRERIVPEGDPDRRAETAVIILLLAAAGCALAFIVIYALEPAGQTQFLGLALGLALALIGAALIVVGKRLVVTEDLEEDYHYEDRADQEDLAAIVRESGGRFTRKRLLAGAAGAAGAALGAALVVPAASLGPVLDTESLYDSPWYRGRRLVDESGKALLAEEIGRDTFYTAFPEDGDREQLGAPLILVRLAPEHLELPTDRADWAPKGILAYSKICTHAGCAVSLYRKALFPPTGPRPALVCPCHYSTFDPAAAGRVLFGPAGRNLPQLPLMIDSDGGLRAAGDFSAPVGPSFWGVRTGRPGPA